MLRTPQSSLVHAGHFKVAINLTVTVGGLATISEESSIDSEANSVAVTIEVGRGGGDVVGSLCCCWTSTGGSFNITATGFRTSRDTAGQRGTPVGVIFSAVQFVVSIFLTITVNGHTALSVETTLGRAETDLVTVRQRLSSGC